MDGDAEAGCFECPCMRSGYRGKAVADNRTIKYRRRG
jgi:hypothetical protein